MADANPTCPVPIPYTRWNLPVRSTEHLRPKRCGLPCLFVVAFCLRGAVAYADLPLTIEDLLTKQGETRINASLTYHNGFSESAVYARVPLKDGRVVYVPISNASIRKNSDILVGTLALRYGITGSIEIYARGSGQYSSVRTSVGSTTDVRFLNTWVGASYQFKKDTETPALIGFVEGALFERGKDSTYALKSWAAGLTAYKSIDPIVFVFSGYYGLNLPRKDGGGTINPGNTLMLNPSVAFSVNDRVTLNTGVRWTNTWPWHTASRQYRETNTDLQLGVDYGFSDDNILNVTFSSNVSGTRVSNLRLDWLHTF